MNRSSPLPVRSPEPTVITYKYSSTSTERKQYPPTVTHHYELDESRTKVETTTEKPRPFPVTEADKLAHPGHQEPPKQVEELMASFSHSEYQVRNKQPQKFLWGTGEKKHIASRVQTLENIDKKKYS